MESSRQLVTTSPDSGQEWRMRLTVPPEGIPHYSHNGYLPIFFYGGDFSSFAPYRFRAPMLIEPQAETPVYPTYWHTREHWFQAHKTDDLRVIEAIAANPDPWGAKQLGNSRSLFQIRGDWDDGYAYRTMLEGIRIQLDAYPRLRDALRETGDRFIAEISSTDQIWAYVIEDGRLTGQNLLGAAWMQARTEIL